MNDAATIELVPIERIRIVNPRARDKRKFAQIVENIAQLGLKRPITVTRGKAGDDGSEMFDLVCGQGRLEAYQALGQTHIPALIREMSGPDALLASLIENIARRRVRPLDQIQLVQWMKDQGQDYSDIAAKTGLSATYVRDLLNMLAHGEERLVEAVLHEQIPISVAIRIAGATDEESQRLLREAYEAKEMTPKTLGAFKRIVDHRRHFGRKYGGRQPSGANPTTAESLVRAYKRESQRQRLLVKKAKLCEGRLLSVIAAFKVLLADENYATLLRAERIETMPRFLAEKARQVA